MWVTRKIFSRGATNLFFKSIFWRFSLFFFSLFCFFCILVFLLICLFFEIKVFILIQIWLCRQVTDKKILHPAGSWKQGYFFFLALDIAPSYHSMPCKGKLMNQTSENCEKFSFRPDFGLSGSNLGPKKIFLAFTSTRCLTLSEAITVCNFKESTWS